MRTRDQQLLEEAYDQVTVPYKIDPTSGHVEWLREGGDLQGAPEVVEGNFSCRRKSLESLEGGPRVVKGDFGCDHNKLKNLKGGPQVVGKRYWCGFNLLRSLDGAPKEVGGGFSCSQSCLRSLEGAPRKVGGDFHCYSNSMKTLKGGPEEVKGLYDCSPNVDLVSLEGIAVGANAYIIPEQFNDEDLKKAFERSKFEKGLDKDTLDTFGDFVDEL